MYGIKVCCLLIMSLVLCYAAIEHHGNDILKMCKDQHLSDGNYRNPQTCSSYIACSGGVTYIMPCPEGLYYKEQGNYCDWPKNVPGCPRH